MAAEQTLQLDGLEPDEPYRGSCPGCGAEVLALELDGLEVVVDLDEVLEEFVCPACAQVAGRGHVRSDCPRCSKTGYIGEPLPLRGVAVNYDTGTVRLFTGERQEGEAVYVYHGCL